MNRIALQTQTQPFVVHYVVYDLRNGQRQPVAAFRYRTHATLFMRSLNAINGSTAFNFEVVANHPGLEVRDVSV